MTFGGMMRAGRLVAVVLVAACFVGLFADTAAAARNKFSANKYASIVVDARSGRVLYASNADASRYPASTTKIMTLYLLFEALDRGQVTLDDRFRVSKHAASQPPSKLGLRPGDTIAVRDALFALVTKSANDVATVVAEGLGKTESNFARQMTAKARNLGMSRTTFRNASGLPDPRQVTTARDMARLAQAILHHYPDYYRHFSRRSFTYRGVEHRNHNRMLGDYEGLDGIKTGYIRASGFNLVASAVRGHQRLIGVVFGGNSSRHRNQHMASLLDDGFEKQARIVTAWRRENEQTLAEIETPAPKPTDDLVVDVGAPAATSGDDDWGIQVGAFREQQTANNAARTAYVHASEFVKQGKVAVVRHSDGSPEPFYLARIHDLGKNQADLACRKLERAGTNCFQLQVKQQTGPEVTVGKASVPQFPAPAAAKARPSGKWGVQVGAYPKHSSAYRTAVKAVKVASGSLNDGVIKVVPLKNGNRRPLYRGRVVGISKDQAEQACQELKARDMACMIVRRS